MADSLTGHWVIVLAAGRGRRMGGPKALMTVSGERWWRRQLHALRAAGVESLWVISQEVGAVLEHEADAPQHLVRADSDAPMFESLMTGVRTLAERTPRGVFVLPVDVPAPRAATLRMLADAPGVGVPHYDDVGGHPVHLRWPWVRESLLDADPRDRRLDVLIRPDRVAVAVSDPSVLANLNTVTDVRAWAAGE